MRCDWINEKKYSVLKGKNILVAGGTGFIGKRAVEIFSNLGMNVYVITRKKYQDKETVFYATADLNNPESLESVFKDMRFDYSVYMAANIPLQGNKKENYYDAKVSTFDPYINFCQAFLYKSDKLVYISSVDVLGGCPIKEFDEEANINIATPYGLAKYIGEFYTRNICITEHIPYAILRYSQVYGPNEPVVRIIPIIKQKLKEKSAFTLFTDGEEKRRFLFIDDAVKGIVHALLYSKEGVYNIAGPDVISMKELVRLMETTWKKKMNLVMKGEVKGVDNIPSIEKARELLEYEPDVAIKDGMMITMEEEKC